MKSAFLLDITQPTVLISFGRSGTTYWSHQEGTERLSRSVGK